MTTAGTIQWLPTLDERGDRAVRDEPRMYCRRRGWLKDRRVRGDVVTPSGHGHTDHPGHTRAAAGDI